MKISLYHIAPFFCLMMLAVSLSSNAQENAALDFEITDSDRERYEDDKIIFSPGGEGETRYVSPRTEPTGSSPVTPKDSISSTSKGHTKPLPTIPSVRKDVPGKNPTKQVPPKQDDDAILSFNFLYYILQKYKLQEIIE